MLVSTQKVGLTVAALGALFSATPAGAQALTDTYWLEVAAYWPDVDTEVQISSIDDDTIGTVIDLEQDLNLDERKFLPSVSAGARLGSGFMIGFDYYSLGRNGSVAINRDIIFDDVTYPTNAVIESEFNTDIYRFTVGYAFARGENYEIGGAIGVHATDFEVSLSGQGTIGGNPVASTQTRRRSALAPLPTLGLFGTWEVASRLTVGARIDYLSLSIDDYDGRLINAQANIVYRLWENVGIGLMYRYVDYRLEVEKEDYFGRIEYKFNGPAVFLQLGF